MDREAFRARFKAYKEGKPVSEIYDAGLPKYVDGTSGLSPDETFVASMGPLLYRELLYQGVENPDSVYNNLITQLGYESDRGRSRVAREQHNYGGVGWNGKRYFSYKNDADFVHDYVKLMNRRYKSAILAKTLSEYASGIKKLGYFEDTLENYSRNLNGMKSLAKAVIKHRQSNPDLYKIDVLRSAPETIVNPVDNTKVVNIIPAEQTHTTWEGALDVSPFITGKPMLRPIHRVQLPNLIDVIEDDLWEPKFPGLKNGKLPCFGNGKGDGMKYSWDDQKQEWNRYTGDEYGDVFADFVVTPRGGAHKKDIKPVKIVTPEQEAFVAQNQPIIKLDDDLFLRNRISEESNKRTWRSDVADALHAVGEGAMMAANFVPFEGELAAGGKWLGSTIKSYLTHPKYITAYHGSPYPFDIKNAWTATLNDLGLHAGGENIANSMSKGGVVYKLRIPSPDTETIDIGSNGYQLLSNNFLMEAHPYDKFSLNGYFDTTPGDYLRIKLLLERGAKPTVVGNRLYTEKDAVIPIRNAVYPNIPETEIKNINEIFRDAKMKTVTEDLFGRLFESLPKDVKIDLNKRANDILSRSGYKVIKYNNVNPYEGGGGTSYIITDPSVIDVMPKNPLTKSLLYPTFADTSYLLSKYEYPGYKNGKSPIHIKPANRGKLTRLKARTGKSESELYNDGNPAHKKMVVFARSSRKWHKG